MIIFKGNSKRANFEKLGVPGPGAYFQNDNISLI